jgi:membrane protease YdiL (CAAX protease family)
MEPYGQNSHSLEPEPWFRRNGFPDWLVAMAWLVVAFLLFQTVGAIVMIGAFISAEGIENLTQQAMLERLDLAIIGNSAGQIAGLGLATLLVARLSVSKSGYAEFMRFRMPANPGAAFGLAVALMVAVQPLIWFMGWFNQQLPMPEYVMNLERDQLEMLSNLMTGGFALWFLIANVALVPAVCEEIMFRSYLHRLLENAYGILAALILTGVLFGLFHLRLTQLIPLSMIGILLGYVTVKTGSVYPAMLMHLLHNGGTVTAVHVHPEVIDMAEADAMPPLFLVAASLVLTGYLIYLLRHRYFPPLSKET